MVTFSNLFCCLVKGKIMIYLRVNCTKLFTVFYSRISLEWCHLTLLLEWRKSRFSRVHRRVKTLLRNPTYIHNTFTFTNDSVSSLAPWPWWPLTKDAIADLGNAAFVRLNAAAFIKFFVIRERRLFEGDIYLKSNLFPANNSTQKVNI